MKKKENMSNFSKSFRTGIKYIRRSRFLTLSSVFSMSVSLFLFLSLMTVVVFSHFVIKGLEDRAQITVFFKPTTAESEILSLAENFKQRPEVEKIKYVSQSDALKIYLGQHQNDPTLLESVSSNLLPASLEIKAKKLGSLESLASEIRQIKSVDEVVFFKDVVETFQKWAAIFRLVSFSLGALMLIVSLLVVLLAVGVSVKIRADEIEIMRLVGATDSQVVAPFLWQGALYGFLASFISLLGFLLLVGLAAPTLRFVVASITIDKEFTWAFVGLLVFHLVLGPFLGVTSGLLGVKKYLKL